MYCICPTSSLFLLLFFCLVLNEFLLILFPPSIRMEIMYFETIVSFHHDTRNYIQHGSFLCQMFTLISTFTLFSDRDLMHLNFIYQFPIYLQYCVLFKNVILNHLRYYHHCLIRECFWFAQYIGFQTEVCVLTGCIETFEEVPERTRFKGKQCPVPLLPYGPFCIT